MIDTILSHYQITAELGRGHPSRFLPLNNGVSSADTDAHTQAIVNMILPNPIKLRIAGPHERLKSSSVSMSFSIMSATYPI